MGVKKLNGGVDDFINKFVKARGGDSTGLDALGAPPSGREVTATGGTQTTVDGFTVHTFSAPDPGSQTFEVSFCPAGFEVDYLVVAGGGGGANGYGGGGGGAGGCLSGVNLPLSTGTYPITVGDGSAGGNPGRTDGGDSSFNNPTGPVLYVAYGGGGGGPWLANGGGNSSGGSGGGGGATTPPHTGGGAVNRGGFGNVGEPQNAVGWQMQGTDAGGGINKNSYGGCGGGGGASGGGGNSAPTPPFGSGAPARSSGPTGKQQTDDYSPGRGMVSYIDHQPTGAVKYAYGGTGGSYNGPQMPAPQNYTNSIGSGGNGGAGSPGRAAVAGQVIIRYATIQALSGDTMVSCTGASPSPTGHSTIDVGNYRTHVFKEPGTLVVDNLAEDTARDEAVVCAIGGGGSGGNAQGQGGGGAGCVLLNRHFVLEDGATYTITVGEGGAATPTGNGNSGTNTTFSPPSPTVNYTANGGGGGGGANHGGCGGGAHSPGTGLQGHSNAVNQDGFTAYGSPGGSSGENWSSVAGYGGGGGGAGGSGIKGPQDAYPYDNLPTYGGKGGDALYLREFSHPTFPAGGTLPGYYGGGGGGFGPGGKGPPGRGPKGSMGPGAPVRPHTGDGNCAYPTAAASDGVVFVRYRFQ